jgi:hypothetical protein
LTGPAGRTDTSAAGLLFHGDNKEVLAHLGGAQPVCPDAERARRR